MALRLSKVQFSGLTLIWFPFSLRRLMKPDRFKKILTYGPINKYHILPLKLPGLWKVVRCHVLKLWPDSLKLIYSAWHGEVLVHVCLIYLDSRQTSPFTGLPKCQVLFASCSKFFLQPPEAWIEKMLLKKMKSRIKKRKICCVSMQLVDCCWVIYRCH